MDVIIGRSIYRELIETCKRLTLFPALRRVLILVPPNQDQPSRGIPQLFVTSGLDLLGMQSQIVGPRPFTENPGLDMEHLRLLVQTFLGYRVCKLERRPPVVEVFNSEFSKSVHATGGRFELSHLLGTGYHD